VKVAKLSLHFTIAHVGKELSNLKVY
jgi:hypothetical protein